MERKHGPWTIKSSERLYADEFAEVWLDEVARPDGEPARRVTMRMKEGVAVLAVDEEGFAHLVKTFRYAVGKDCVETVQGGTEEGEEPERAARRELKEELGAEAEEWTDLGLVDAVTSQVYSPARIFLARRLSFGEPETESTESLQPFKVKFDEAVRMVMDGEITQGISCALILKAERLLRGERAGAGARTWLKVKPCPSCACVVKLSGGLRAGGPGLRLELLLHLVHLRAELVDLVLVQHLARLLEHLLLLLLDVVLDVLLEHLELGRPLLGVDRHRLQLLQQHLDDVVLLEAFEHDLARLGRLLDGRVEDGLLDLRVDVELLPELGEELGARLLGALGRRLQLLEDAGDLLVVLLQQLKSVHSVLLLVSVLTRP
jgi:8-oxo-dGTP pyrophosphatase MutT (NUDIX family)